jgi:ketopantoate hydroxymethyltransferase
MSGKDEERQRNITAETTATIKAMITAVITAVIMVAITAEITTTAKVPPIVIPSETRELSSA